MVFTVAGAGRLAHASARMNLRHLVPVVALLGLCFTSSAQKAYEVVKYAGKEGALSVSFAYADGYPEASELTLSEGGKSVKMQPEGGEMNFQGTLAKTPIQVRVAMDPYAEAPAAVEVTVLKGKDETKLTLKKK
jgi:hypothetical protein